MTEKLTDFEQAMEQARDCAAIARSKHTPVIKPDALMGCLNRMAAAHAVVVEERDALNELATTPRSSLAAMKLMRDNGETERDLNLRAGLLLAARMVVVWDAAELDAAREKVEG